MAHGYRTDHSIIYLTIDTKVCQRGKGFWKFNVSLLYNPGYVKLVKEEIHNVKTQYHTKNNEVHSFSGYQWRQMHLINHLPIIVKRYIYISKFGPSKLDILAVHNSIREVYDIKKNNVIRKSINDKKIKEKMESTKGIFRWFSI